MFSLFQSFFGKNASMAADLNAASREPAPLEIYVDGMPPFPLGQHLVMHQGFPMLDWKEVRVWMRQAGTEDIKQKLWVACERGWLLHLRDALGGSYNLSEAESACVLSALKPGQARATLDFMSRTRLRVAKVLHGMATIPPLGRDILIMFEDADRYYAYASYFYPEDGGEFAGSGGMFISRGCGHYITRGDNLSAIEHVIAHEMTHGQLSHLNLPAWLNEGLAVNTERRLAPALTERFTPREMHQKHLALWDEKQIQEFWSGDAFHDPVGDNQHLAYDLARIMVMQLSRDWQQFTQFVLNAKRDDGGALASLEHLGMDLGHVACALLEGQDAASWSPDPEVWPDSLDTEADQ